MKRRKIKPAERLAFLESWEGCLEALKKDLYEWKIAQVHVLNNTPLTEGVAKDMDNFARESFLHELKKFYDYHYPIEAALQETKYLINPE